MKTFESSLVETAHSLAQVQLTCRAVDVAEHHAPLLKKEISMSVRYDGTRSGKIYLIIDEDSAIDLAFRMLEYASGGYFDRNVIDRDLARNTVGEILNIAVGDFIRNTGSAGDVRLYSPEQHVALPKDFSARFTGYVCSFDSRQFEVMFDVA